MGDRVLRRGTRLGKYRLVRRIGRGAFADVWKARDTVQKQDVALKIALPEQAAEHGREALELEARIAGKLDHPNVVAVRNADWINGRFVLATELAERSLADYPGARRSGRIALRVIRDVVSGLAHAHALGVLHRDVKPDNVLIFPDGRAALSDFGAARFTGGASRAYTEAGTLGYMAPEQAYGRPRPASDVFSLGLIAYEILTGFLPTWPFDWPPERHARFVERVPEPLRPIFKKAAAFDPEDRYVDAVALKSALERGFERAERPAPRRNHRRKRLPERTPLEVQARLFQRRHGKALEMNVACHRCDLPIAESMPRCPWCGTDENSFRHVTRYPLVCPECERGVRAEWTACPWCYRGRLEGNGRPPRHDAKAERRCSARHCPGELRPFMRYCPICKQKPRRVWSHPDLPQRCPRCRGPVSKAFWRFCPWCGRHEPSAGSFGGR
ncbi:MAG: serine/threonine-protein kinase [Myxococcota bacterium]|nr:serine/threonine-protein kinase [Myxococcota bacterium]